MGDSDESDDVRITGCLLAGVLAICLARMIGVVAQDEREHRRAAELAREEYRLTIWRTWPEQLRLQVEIARAIYRDPSAD